MQILETERLILREMTMDDLPATRAIMCDAETLAAWPAPFTEDENLQGLRKQIQSYQENGFGRWGALLKETGDLIGICGPAWCEADGEQVLEIGYLFNRKFWGKGYATEAAMACKNYAFDVLKADEVFSLVSDTNYASMNVAIRNGMLVRGRFVKQYKGVDMPHYIFSVRRQELSFV